MNTDNTQDKSLGQIAAETFYEGRTVVAWENTSWQPMWERSAAAVLLAHSQSKAAEGGQALLTGEDVKSCNYLRDYSLEACDSIATNLNAILGIRTSTPASEPEVRWLEYEPGETVVMEGDETLVARDRWAQHQQTVGQVNRFTVRRPSPAADSGKKPRPEENITGYGIPKVRCTCKFDEGHEAHCAVVLANELIRLRGKSELDQLGLNQLDVVLPKLREVEQERSSLQAQVETLAERLKQEDITLTSYKASYDEQSAQLLAETARANKAEADFSEIKTAGARIIEAEKARADRAEKIAKEKQDQSDSAIAWYEKERALVESLRTANERLTMERDHAEARYQKARLSQQRGELTMSDLEEAQEAVGWDAKGMADFLNKRIYVTMGGLTAEQVQQAIFAFYEEPDLEDCEKIAGILNQHLLPILIPQQGSLTREALIEAFFTSFPNGLSAGATVPTEAWDEMVKSLNASLLPIWTTVAPGSMPQETNADGNGHVLWRWNHFIPPMVRIDRWDVVYAPDCSHWMPVPPLPAPTHQSATQLLTPTEV